MSVTSIASPNAHNAAPQTLKQPETKEAGPDHDGDTDDAGVNAVAPVAPTVNTAGQSIGSTISTKA